MLPVGMPFPRAPPGRTAPTSPDGPRSTPVAVGGAAAARDRDLPRGDEGHIGAERRGEPGRGEPGRGEPAPLTGYDPLLSSQDRAGSAAREVSTVSSRRVPPSALAG